MYKIYFLLVLSVLLSFCKTKTSEMDLKFQEVHRALTETEKGYAMTDSMLTASLKKDTLVFTKENTLEKFILSIGLSAAYTRIRTLPSGKLNHYLYIEKDSVQHNIHSMDTGFYSLNIKYGYDKKKTKLIRKTIKIE